MLIKKGGIWVQQSTLTSARVADALKKGVASTEMMTMTGVVMVIQMNANHIS